MSRPRLDVISKFAGRRESIDGPTGRAWGRSLSVDLMPGSDLLSVYQVTAPLKDYLTGDAEDTEARPTAFGRDVIGRVKEIGEPT